MKPVLDTVVNSSPAVCREREQRIDRHRLLHRDERVTPDRGHADERDDGWEARPDHPRRLLADRGGMSLEASLQGGGVR